MFKNIGSKIKKLATVLTIIGIVASILSGVGLMVLGNKLKEAFPEFSFSGIAPGIAIIILGPLMAWLGSFVLYGFGELIDKTSQIAASSQNKGQRASRSEYQNPTSVQGNMSQENWKCEHCGTDNAAWTAFCQRCGKSK